jgi:NAD(P)-dependent dehydrogenase (short-subunit alcohol dehydrogenase family)
VSAAVDARESTRASLAAGIAGAALGIHGTGGVTMLLYTQPGFLATAGFLVALVLAGTAGGVWAGAAAAAEPARRPDRAWTVAVVAFGVAAAFASLWAMQPALRTASPGGAAAALLLLAAPAYAVGAVLARLCRGRDAAAAAALLGTAAGVLAAVNWLIPRLDPPFLFLAAGVVIAAASPLAPRRHRTLLEPVMQNRVVIVSGVGDAGQLGFAVAHAFVSAGAHVLVTSRGDGAERLAPQLGAGVRAVRADLTQAGDAARVVQAALDEWGHVDALINVAGGLSVTGPVEQTSDAEWAAEYERNATTTFVLTRAALPHLRAVRGAVVNFASPAGVRAVGNMAAYSAAKAAVVALTRSLALEERERGVRVNAIAPGFADTVQNRADAAPTARYVSREDIAAAAVFLASDAAAGVSGETLHVMGPTLR